MTAATEITPEMWSHWMTYTLYHTPRTRSGMVIWLAEEIGAPYAIHKLDVKAGEGKDPAFMALSPYGKVPALRDSSTTINETGAITLYLADKYSYGALAPRLEDPRRGNYLRWVFTANSSMDAALVNVMTQREPMEQVQASLPRILDFVEATLKNHPYVCGEAFTAADVLVASGLNWGRSMKALPDTPAIQDYLARITARPAFQRARDK